MNAHDITMVTMYPIGHKPHSVLNPYTSQYVAQETMVCMQKPIQDFAKARNSALKRASCSYRKWALIRDTDMHWEQFPSDWFERLETTKADMIQLYAADGAYPKASLFRLPLTGKFVGRTHEYYDNGAHIWETWDYPRFAENPKTPEQMEAKAKRDIRLLHLQMSDGDTLARWHYYLAESHFILKEWDEAIAHYWKAGISSLWDEERAWSYYRMAEAYCFSQRIKEARKACFDGMEHCAWFAELHWLAAFLSLELKEYSNAIALAMCAERLGEYKGIGAQFQRGGFKYPTAQYEGPYDVLRHTFRELNMPDMANMFHEKYEQAKSAKP